MPKYFHFRSDDKEFNAPLHSMRCTCIKGDGHQCKNRVVFGLPYCHVHEKSKKHLVVKTSTIPNSGDGVFVVDTLVGVNDVVFKKDVKICAYSGELITRAQLEERYGDATAPYGIQLNKNMCEDGALERGIGTLLNHNPKKSNVRFSIGTNNRINIVATKNIKNGAELFVSYGNKYRMHEQGVESCTNNKKFTL